MSFFSLFSSVKNKRAIEKALFMESNKREVKALYRDILKGV